MKCRDAIQEISNFLDGDLDGGLRRELESHFSECDECRLMVVQTKKTIEIFLESEATPLPTNVRTRLHDRLQKHLGRPQN